MAKEFIFETKVFLGDVNIYGTAYFAKYFEWQGMARELLFITLIPDYLKFNGKYKMITIEASVNYKSEANVFDDILIKIEVANIKLTTYELHFSYFNKKSNNLIATGKQKIGFTDLSGKVVTIPMELIKAWMVYSPK